ncbi:gamma-glutamyltransferase [Zobellia nedashkovskayae]
MLLGIVLIGLWSGNIANAQDRITGENFAGRSEVIATNGMVASSHPLATQIGLDILKKGGTAIDAAIAVDAALGLMEPTGSGIGGDLFAIIWDEKNQKLHGLNASGRSPKSLKLEYFKKNDLEKNTFHRTVACVRARLCGWLV